MCLWITVLERLVGFGNHGNIFRNQRSNRLQRRCLFAGFLSTGSALASGNNGLKDQVMALRWIQQNIHHFGGDPSCVSIIGESAGAAAASYHLLSPMSRGHYSIQTRCAVSTAHEFIQAFNFNFNDWHCIAGLFSSAISISGSALCPWAIARNPRSTFDELAGLVNCTGNSTEAKLACLEGVPFETILRNQALTVWPKISKLRAFKIC